jgi:hypothetical protein
MLPIGWSRGRQGLALAANKPQARTWKASNQPETACSSRLPCRPPAVPTCAAEALLRNVRQAARWSAHGGCTVGRSSKQRTRGCQVDGWVGRSEGWAVAAVMPGRRTTAPQRKHTPKSCVQLMPNRGPRTLKRSSVRPSCGRQRGSSEVGAALKTPPPQFGLLLHSSIFSAVVHSREAGEQQSAVLTSSCRPSPPLPSPPELVGPACGASWFTTQGVPQPQKTGLPCQTSLAPLPPPAAPAAKRAAA